MLIRAYHWLKKMYIYTMKYYSASRKNEIMPFAENGLESLLLSRAQKTLIMFSL